MTAVIVSSAEQSTIVEQMELVRLKQSADNCFRLILALVGCLRHRDKKNQLKKRKKNSYAVVRG